MLNDSIQTIGNDLAAKRKNLKDQLPNLLRGVDFQMAKEGSRGGSGYIKKKHKIIEANLSSFAGTIIDSINEHLICPDSTQPEIEKALTMLFTESFNSHFEFCNKQLQKVKEPGGSFTRFLNLNDIRASLLQTHISKIQTMSRKVVQTSQIKGKGTLMTQNINFNAPIQNNQIGNNNVQAGQLTINQLIQQIDSLKGNEEQKKELKGLLRKILDHPLTSTIATSLISAGATIASSTQK